MCKVEIEPESKLITDEFEVLKNQEWLWIPSNIHNDLLHQTYNSSYIMHPGVEKMCHDLKEVFWWKCMKRDVLNYVIQCLTC